MSQPQSSAERVAAHRARQKEAEQAKAAEDAYVDRELEITRQRYASDPQLAERLKRSERYARFRWHGVQDGTVASL